MIAKFYIIDRTCRPRAKIGSPPTGRTELSPNGLCGVDDHDTLVIFKKLLFATDFNLINILFILTTVLYIPVYHFENNYKSTLI